MRMQLQHIYGLDASASIYDIEDTAAALISAGDHVLNVSGVANITVDAPDTGYRG